MKVKVFIITCLLAFTFSKCETPNLDFPFVPVEKSYNMLLPSNQDLEMLCGSVVDSLVGYRGVVIFRQALYEVPSDFICFDLACTSESCHYKNKIKVEKLNMFAVCPVCNTEYDMLSFGWPTEPNASSGKSNPLYQYKTYYNPPIVSIENK